MDNLLYYMMKEQIEKAVKEWGIEGTEDKIKAVYVHNPELKNSMLRTLRKMYGIGKE